MAEGSSYPENGKLRKGRERLRQLSQKAGSNQELLQTKRFKGLPSRMLGRRKMQSMFNLRSTWGGSLLEF